MVLLACVVSVVVIKMAVSGRYGIDVWMEDGYLNIAGPARVSTKSEEARDLAFECKNYDEIWGARIPGNHHEEEMRQSDLKACMDGQLRELRRLEGW